MILELENPIPVITPKGKASAKFLIDRGVENDLEWVCVQDDTCECWTWRNPDIRFQKNITEGRDNVSPFTESDSVKIPKITKKCPICNGGIEVVMQWEDDKNYIVFDRCTQCCHSHF